MLRISEIGPPGERRGLRLEGRLVGPWVVELRVASANAMATVVGGEGPFQLRLREVDYVDAAGVVLLLELRARGVVLAECPPFVEEQLKAAGGRSMEP